MSLQPTIRIIYRLLFIVTLCCQLNYVSAQNKAYPNRPIKITVGFAPGGAPDLIARLIAQKMADQLGQPVIIENKAGATGNIAVQAVSKMDPDGYNLLLGTVSMAISPAMAGGLNLNPEKEFEAIGMVASVPMVLIASTAIPANSVKELIKYAKDNPGKINFASVGNGSPQQLSAELFQIQAGIQMTHIPYKGGAPATQAVLAKEVDIFFAGMPPALPFIQAGKVKAFAVTSEKRSAAAKDIPTMQEAGLAGFEADNWNALYAPKGTPKEIIQSLNLVLNQVLQMSDVVENLEKQGAQPWSTSPQTAKEYLLKEQIKWAKVVKAAGVKAE